MPEDLEKLSKRRLIQEVERARDGRRLAVTFEGLRQASTIITSAFQWAGLLGIAYFSYRTVELLAGKSTMADIGVGINLLGNTTINSVVAWTCGVGGVVYGTVQKRLRRTTIERMNGRVGDLERAVDPGRTSSNLTQRGETRPEDSP